MKVKRYTMAYDYLQDGEGCQCDVQEDKDGYYVEHEDYLKLEKEYLDYRKYIQQKEERDAKKKLS